MSRTLQHTVAGAAGPADRPVGPLALIGIAPGRDAVAAVLEECGVEFVVATAVGSLDLESPPGATILCAAGSLAAATAEIDALRVAAPAAAVLVVCAEVRPGELRQAIAAGAAGVVLESSLGAALETTLAAMRAGQVCVPRRESRQIEPSTLSAREKQILGLVVMGYMNSEIAEQLFVAVSTVKSHLSSAFAKLGVRSRSEAVELIIDPERGLGMGILALGGEPLETSAGAS